MHQSCHLFFDNYFTTIYSLNELKQRGIYATGTVRLSRAKFPKVCMYVRKHVYVCMMYAHVDGMHVSCVMYHMRMHVHVLGFY